MWRELVMVGTFLRNANALARAVAAVALQFALLLTGPALKKSLQFEHAWNAASDVFCASG